MTIIGRLSARALAGASALALLASGVTPAHAGSGTRHVAMRGVDSAECGAKKAPCRTISQAIANAAAGATILVGPGRYGDLDGDGTLRAEAVDLGEEDPALCQADSCALRVTKPVSVVSSHGPGATVLDGGKQLLTTMLISAPGAVLGRPKQGFTIVGSLSEGVRVLADDVRIEGNIVTANEADAIALDTGDRTTVRGNLLAGNGRLGILATAAAEGTFILGNHIVANGLQSDGAGIETHTDPTISGNVINANRGAGILVISGGASIRGNDLSGNEHVGVLVGGGAVAGLRGNAIRANRSAGVYIAANGGADILDNDIYANDPLGQNCGIRNGAGTEVEATGNYWGHPDGPGANPADLACDVEAGSTTTVDPVAPKSIKLKLKVGR